VCAGDICFVLRACISSTEFSSGYARFQGWLRMSYCVDGTGWTVPHLLNFAARIAALVMRMPFASCAEVYAGLQCEA
jgi:hypothetical protein